MLNHLIEIDDFLKAWEMSVNQPIFILKHSTTCPISANAFKVCNSKLGEFDAIGSSYLVKVIEDRVVSNEIAKITEVAHQSPQLLLISNKEVIWKSSHWSITEESISQAISLL